MKFSVWQREPWVCHWVTVRWHVAFMRSPWLIIALFFHWLPCYRSHHRHCTSVLSSVVADVVCALSGRQRRWFSLAEARQQLFRHRPTMCDYLDLLQKPASLGIDGTPPARTNSPSWHGLLVSGWSSSSTFHSWRLFESLCRTRLSSVWRVIRITLTRRSDVVNLHFMFRRSILWSYVVGNSSRHTVFSEWQYWCRCFCLLLMFCTSSS